MNAIFGISTDTIEKAIGSNSWDLCNDVLYALCRDRPRHKATQDVLAKIVIIGRVHSASLERRKPSGSFHSDGFLDQIATPAIQGSHIDFWFDELSAASSKINSERPLDLLLRVHRDLTLLFQKISGQRNRSLAAKYLHCHFPDLFYVFNTRSAATLRKYVSMRNATFRGEPFADSQYERFFLSCERFNDQAETCLGRRLSPRQMDKVLLELSKQPVPTGMK